MDDEVKSILSDLYRTINRRLESSKDIDRHVQRLEELGYKLSIYMEATILLSRPDDEQPAANGDSAGKRVRKRPSRVRSAGLTLDDQDMKFLKSLRIAFGKPGEK